jgi:hypothetical protein
MGRDIIARGMASGAIKVNINAGHIFVDNTARDTYFVTNPTELVENMYVYCNSKLQQYDGSIWVDRTPAIKGETGTGVPTGGTTSQVLTKNSNGDYDFSWVDFTGGGDMVKSLYDTANKQVDVYDMDNMEDGTTYVKTENNFTDNYKNKIDDNVLKSHTHENKTALDNTSGTNTGDETNATIISKIGYTPENTLNKGVNNGYCALDSGGKVPLQNLPSTLLKYIGTWNASTNTPALTSPDLTKTSWVYEVTTAGTRFGEDWKSGDWLIYNADGVAEKSDNSDDVVSVNGKTGVVVINKADVGLSNVDNTSDLDKPISSLTQTALNLKADKSGLTTHTTNTNNPHTVTKTQVGLGNVANIDTSVTTNITDISSKRFVSDADKAAWNAKRDTLSEITQRTITSAGWISAAYGNGIFVAVASSGTNRAMWSVDGITWNTVSVEVSGWRSVTYGNGIFVAVASSGTNRAMWSVDGITWNTVSVEVSDWRSVAYGNGIFVAVAVSGTNRAMWSTDGITWNAISVEVSDWRSVAYGNGIFVAVAVSGTNRAMWSTDGITWNAISVEISQWRSVTYGNGIFVAVASSGTNRAMWSVDGITWTTVAIGSDTWYSVTYGNGIFVAFSITSRLMWSTDGKNWYYKNIPLMNWYATAYGDGMFVALAYDSSDGLLTIGERTYSDKCKVIKKSVIGELSTTILSTDWTGTGPFEDTIPITISGEQITSTTHDIEVSLVLSSDINVARQEQEAYSYFSKGEISATNVLKITCFDYKPIINLNLLLEVVKKWQ